jgi:Domain of unknown function (DUF6602)
MKTPNPHLMRRLQGMQQMLLGVHSGGDVLTNTSRGTEREAFVNSFLRAVFPPPFRFGTGDITDQAGHCSGQLDIVIEFPFVPSLPLQADSPRLYLAEGVAAVVEVKSDVATQWEQVLSTAKQLQEISRSYGSGISLGPRAPEKIPLYAVGYRGWKDFGSVQSHFRDHPEVSGILVVESGHFYGRYDALTADDKPYVFFYKRQGSAMALWGLIACIHHATSMITSKTKDIARCYDAPDT